MTNILLLYERTIPTVEMCVGTFQAFSDKYNCIFRSKSISETSRQDIDNADVVISVRGESPLMLGLLEYAGLINKFRIFMLDDDLLNLPKDSFRYPKRKKWLKLCLEESDVFLTSSQLLADEYKQYVTTNRAYVIHTDVKEEEIQGINKEVHDKVRIVYAASERHIAFFDKYIRPCMKDIVERYGDKIEFYFVGVMPTFEEEEIKRRINVIPSMPYEEYISFMNNAHFDIGLAPLEVNRFTARKYFNKFIEYTKEGICGLYSDCMPYKLVVENGVNGYLVGDNPEDWLSAIEYAIDYPAKRIECIENAQELLREKHNPQRIFEQLQIDIPELTTYKSNVSLEEPKLRFKNSHRMFRIKERCYLTFCSLKKDGINETYKRIKKHIK